MNRGLSRVALLRTARRADEHPVPHEHHVRLRLVVEVGEPAHDGPSESATRLDLERALSGS
jgi:hypothetical protein